MLLAKGAEAFGFRGDVWTTARIADVILQEFGVSYHPAHCSRLVRQLGQTQQKPIEKATQRKEAAIAAWKNERWDELKKRPKPNNEPLSL